MKPAGWRASVASMTIGVTCILSTALWAGGAGFGDDDDTSEEEGPSYFGFVKDTNGATVPDAKVTVGIKNRGGIVTRTDALGAYKVPGFGKDVDPKDVEIACDKQGYKQLRTLRRMRSPNADPKIPVETECTLQRT
jgi:hypothetical protein